MLPKHTDTNICNSTLPKYPHHSAPLYLLPTLSHPQFLRNKHFNLFDKSSISYICLFYVKLPENDRTQIETCLRLVEMYVTVHCSNTCAFVAVQYTIFHECTAYSTAETFHTSNPVSFRTTWQVDNETPTLTVTTSRYSCRMLCWFSAVRPSRQSTTISCQTLSSSSLTSSHWLMNRQGSERQRSQPDDAHPGDHEALTRTAGGQDSNGAPQA